MTSENSQEEPIILDPQQGSIHYVDWVTSAGINEGVINLCLGSIDYVPIQEAADRGRVISASKLRMSPGFAQRLGELLLLMAEDARKGHSGTETAHADEG